jgi:tetratricopeptide (TPR) repeat protein
MEIDPSNPVARANLAELYARQDDVPSAIRLIEALATETPQSWWIWEKLGELKARVGRFSEAAAHFRRAVERKQGDPSLLYKLARATFDSGSTAEAKVILDEAAPLAPGHDAILRLYAEIYEASFAWGDLASVAESWLHNQPRNPLPWRYAATAQWETGYLKQAMQSYRTFLDRGGRDATNLATYGRLCLTALAYDEASRALDEAEQLDPECGHMLSAKATLAMFHGRFEDALAYARKANQVDPRDMAALKVRVKVSGGRITEDERAQLRRLSENPELRPEVRIPATFALADCLDAEGDADAAFAAYERANQLGAERARRERLDYDRADRTRQTDRLISIFRTAPKAGQIDSRPTPIFVVGMPRSGTTLIESIVGAHSEVFACGERQEMRSIMQEFVALASRLGMAGVAGSAKQQWREAFWRELPDLHGAIAVTDKNPWNFDALPLILELFPHARVIHVCRDPVETGLSIYRNEFPKFVAFAHRLEDIGHYYGEYTRLMAHWQSLLRDRFMTVRYEDVIADVDRAAQDLVRFCGLEWQQACGEFWRSDRIIRTMSTVQARRSPTQFSGRSGRYAQHLLPLIAALREARVDLPLGDVAPERSP